MLHSMTAFGRSSLKSSSGEFVCEIRSVNHRYLDVSVRTPEALRAIEPTVREKLSAALQRGKVEVAIKHTQTSSASQSFDVNEGLLNQLSEAARKVATVSGSKSDIDLLRLMQWPGVLVTRDDSQALMAKDAIEVLELALQDFVSTREREGAQIASLLTAKCDQLQNCLLEVRKVRPAVLEHQREKWLSRLAQLSTPHDESRLEQELLHAAQRLDIDEELDRLDAHCKELGNALNRSEPVGRRLDFIMQEFNREANTLASKSGDISTTSAAVDMKVLIEQMREQIQNVE